jgi:hypothetical protein
MSQTVDQRLSGLWPTSSTTNTRAESVHARGRCQARRDELPPPVGSARERTSLVSVRISLERSSSSRFCLSSP